MDQAVVGLMEQVVSLLEEIRDLLKTQNQMEYGADTGLMP